MLLTKRFVYRRVRFDRIVANVRILLRAVAYADAFQMSQTIIASVVM
jgi:hypothetical protein